MIDLEVAHSQPSPTIDPSVHVVLVGHSMGGIVAAETLLLLASEKPLPHPSNSAVPSRDFPSTTTQKSATSTSHPTPPIRHPHDPNKPPDEPADLSPEGFLFPHIRGILAFDTPYLGLAPGVFAHGAEGHYKAASAAYSTLSELGSAFGWGAKSSTSTAPSQPVAGYLPSAGAQAVNAGADAAAAPKWQAWGKYAMFAGAAGVAAGGAAALYSQRDKLDLGWRWISSHLEFVGCLARAEELKQRVENLSALDEERGIGSANCYTILGKGASDGQVGEGLLTQTAPKERTFCSLPNAVLEGKEREQQSGLRWIKATNDKARDETTAHTSMFFPKENPSYFNLGGAAAGLISGWIDKGWYKTSTGGSGGGGTTIPEEATEGWDKADQETWERAGDNIAAGAANNDEAKEEWEGVAHDSLDGADDEDVETEELGDSVIVEKKGSSGLIPQSHS